VSNDPSEVCNGIVMSCVYVIGNKNKTEKIIFLSGPIGKQVT